MTTSQTTAFNPSLGDLTLNAFGRIGIRPTQLVADHLVTARMEANLLQASWANQGPNLWTVDLQTVALTPGTATYTLPSSTISLLDVYLTTSAAGDQQMMPISRSDYASYSAKGTTGTPSVFWFDRLISPTITLYPVPDSAQTYTLKYYRFRYIYDAVLANGLTPEIPARWADALTAGLAYRLARQFNQALEPARKVDAQEAYDLAAGEDVENVNMYFSPGLSGYFR